MPEDQKFMVNGNSVTPHYFEAMGIASGEGARASRPTIGENAPPVMVINEAFASRFWPDGDAMGHLVQDGIGPRDHRRRRPRRGAEQSRVTWAAVLSPIDQKPIVTPTFVVRAASGDPSRFTADLRRIVHDLDPMLPIYNITTARQTVDFNLAGRRSFEWLMIAFGVIALLLATMGVYAVTSFFVSQRTQELGLRVALGADPMRLLAFVMRSTAGMAVGGALIGLGGAFLAARWLSHTLYGVGAGEPTIYVAAAVLLTLGTLAASIGPANRAARADPMTTLRVD